MSISNPLSSRTLNGTTPVFPGPSHSGVTARDWLAAQAMQGIISKGLAVTADRAMTEDDRDDAVAVQAYRMADAMLRARTKTASPPKKRPL